MKNCSLIILFGYLILTLGDSVFESNAANKIKKTFEKASKLSPTENIHIAKWMENCEKKLGSEEWEKIKVIPTQIYPCMRKYLKPKVAQEEIEDSITRGDLDLVFKKYCGRKQKILSCLYKDLERIKPCLDESQIDNLNITQTAMDAGVDFICSENGDKIALFMAERGKECVRDKKKQIKECLKIYFQDVSQSMNNIKFIQFDHLFISKDTCRNFTSTQHCIVNATSDCEDPTPSNILDSLMTEALKVTPCVQTSGYLPIFYTFISQILHPYFLTIIVVGLSTTHILL